MAYVDPDYTTKKAFIAAVKAGTIHHTYHASGMFPTVQDGRDVVEGPHFPKPHRWYAEVQVKGGVVTSAR